jgi:hypothetical protein
VRRRAQLRNEEKCFIFFEKNGIYFHERDKGLLLRLSSFKLYVQQLVELFNHERQLQSRIAAEGTSTSAASSEVAFETQKRHAEVENPVLQKPQMKRIKTSFNQISQSDQPLRRNNESQKRRVASGPLK